jgi:hypothetical protein
LGYDGFERADRFSAFGWVHVSVSGYAVIHKWLPTVDDGSTITIAGSLSHRLVKRFVVL